MRKKLFWWSAGTALALVFAVIQFIPSPPVVLPVSLPVEQREAHRELQFEGIANFRDIGGYTSYDGRQVKWGLLYRSGALNQASRDDLQNLEQLQLHTLVDFRTAAEKQAEPDRLPASTAIEVVEIPTFDNGDDSIVNEITTRIENDTLHELDPDAIMVAANQELAQGFTTQYRQFIDTVLAADGKPILWHCTAGKDRAGFAAAILLRLLGVPQEQVMADYMMSKSNALAARKNQLRILKLFKGEQAAQRLEKLMGVEPQWLQAAFDTIDEQYGNFDGYVRHGLGLNEAQVKDLRKLLLEIPANTSS